MILLTNKDGDLFGIRPDLIQSAVRMYNVDSIGDAITQVIYDGGITYCREMPERVVSIVNAARGESDV